MAELLKKNYEKRVFFSSGRQKYFLSKARKNSNLSWILFTEKVGVHKRTLNDWRREKYSMPLDVVRKISKIAKIEIPKNIKIKEPFWYVYKGAKLGGRLGAIACFKKYGSYGGNPEYRKKKWYEWWEKEGKYNNNLTSVTKSIREPRKSIDLAEFAGIIIGDGGITKNQVIISLDPKTDREYVSFVTNFLTKLFGVKPSIYSKNKGVSVVKIAISRVKLVNFCRSIGLKVGNKLKQGLDVPDWIKEKESFKISCVRGLMDTDGCFFVERHKIKGKIYSYPRIAITSYSKNLCDSVFTILEELGFSPRIRGGRNVQLENIAEIKKYFKLIRTNNFKHKRKFETFLEGCESG